MVQQQFENTAPSCKAAGKDCFPAPSWIGHNCLVNIFHTFLRACTSAFQGRVGIVTNATYPAKFGTKQNNTLPSPKIYLQRFCGFLWAHWPCTVHNRDGYPLLPLERDFGGEGKCSGALNDISLA